MEVKDVIEFWFTTSSMADWFKKDSAFDEEIRSRFGDLHSKVANGETKEWRSTPEGRLAEIIVLDQFSRNMFRDTPQAFAYDALALSLAREAVQSGDDQKLSDWQRHFLYMPYMHSESKEAHEEGLKLFQSIGENNAKPALEHKEIIDRFGRYPHRNAILGRVSTPEEIEFLKDNPGF